MSEQTKTTMPQPTFRLSTVDRLAKIAASDWDQCANPTTKPYNPFVSHSFLKALEDSGSVGEKTGWQPLHLTIHDDDKRLVAAAPLYAKSHSYGEYVFDWQWADAYERAGGRYFPKLVCAAPFTPASGPRLLVRSDTEHSEQHLRSLLLKSLINVCKQTNTSSLHINFPLETEANAAEERGWIKRLGLQFHWHNQGYGTFDDFLNTFNARKRKAVKKERREAQAFAFQTRILQGGDILEEHWDAFYRFYTNTSNRKWNSAYLTREFFSLINAQDAVLVMLFDNSNTAVAGALNLLGSDCLYGRNWGCDEQFKMLHFEACYYQAIEFAIANKLDRVEAGAQGHHKLQRGYLPSPTYSLHWIKDPQLDAPVRHYVQMEAEQTLADIHTLTQNESPYKSGPSS